MLGGGRFVSGVHDELRFSVVGSMFSVPLCGDVGEEENVRFIKCGTPPWRAVARCCIMCL
jgi:3'-phosphoadenosine 5'-phosphosulfate sulfotransferase